MNENHSASVGTGMITDDFPLMAAARFRSVSFHCSPTETPTTALNEKVYFQMNEDGLRRAKQTSVYEIIF